MQVLAAMGWSTNSIGKGRSRGPLSLQPDTLDTLSCIAVGRDEFTRTSLLDGLTPDYFNIFFVPKTSLLKFVG